MNENAARNLAEAPATYAKDAVERSTIAADGAFNVVEQFHAKAGKGAKDLNLHFIVAARANMNATFDFAQQLMAVTSPSEFFELSAAHARKQFEMLNEQIKQLSALVQKAATDSAQPGRCHEGLLTGLLDRPRACRVQGGARPSIKIEG